MGHVEAVFSFDIGGFPVIITQGIITQWVIIAIVGIMAVVFTRKLTLKPGKKQLLAEWFYTTVGKAINVTLEDGYDDLIPFVGSLGIFVLFMNLSALFGVPPATADLSVTAGLGLVSFYMVQAYAIRKIGIKHYFIGYSKPNVIMLPFNILEKILLPISLALRLFGNIFAATLLMELIYSSLMSVSWFAGIGAPMVASLYFDIFDGTIQMVIFIMLTMVNIKITAEH
ncbi:MAG: F0F1 ATP synthase subunit A [Clostridium sp.]